MIERADKTGFVTINHECDLCIVGGGMAGMCAAISAARHGIKVVIMQDRPVFGGNASSEVRMWIRGAHGENMRETGIIEEIALENIYRNPQLNFSIWDSVLFGKMMDDENIEYILNCSCLEAETEDNSIKSVTGWQTTTQTFHKVTSKLFADCSGDSILAPLTGAQWRMGRESCDEFDEDIAPKISDNKTMGMSCLIQVRQTDRPVKYKAPKWAYKFKKEDFTNKVDFSEPHLWQECNFWWMELGGVADSIADTESLRDELIKTVYGVWDFYKNSGVVNAENWDIEWIGFLPGKRESRRYVGDILLTQNDVRAEGKFNDLIAYGGWTMDDHNPEGFKTTEPPTTYHSAPSPYGIPYRCLYSKNIDNLMFAGRNISATHSALSSTRVMATCAIMGQALGTAASIAVKNSLSPRGVYENKIDELKQTLILDDCYLPWNTRVQTKTAKSFEITAKSDISALKDGINRPVNGIDHAFIGEIGEEILFTAQNPVYVEYLNLICDSDLDRKSFGDDCRREFKTYPMRCHVRLNTPDLKVPDTIISDFDVYADGELIVSVCDNYQRLVKIPVNKSVKTIKFIPKRTHGADKVRIYSLEPVGKSIL